MPRTLRSEPSLAVDFVEAFDDIRREPVLGAAAEQVPTLRAAFVAEVGQET